MTGDPNNEWDISPLQEMIQYDLRGRGITHQRVLAAFNRIDRQHFMPDEQVDEAYADRPASIECGQTISQPFIVAQMLEYLQVDTSHRVLELGTGSGYSTALIAELAASVDSLDVFPELLKFAYANLNRQAVRGIRLFLGSGWSALPEQTYDRIVVWASPPRIPENLINALAIDGIMVIPVGKQDQYVQIVRKTDQGVSTERRDPVRFVPLIREDLDARPYSPEGEIGR